MLAATIVRGAQDGAIERLFDWTGADEPAAVAARGAAARRGSRAARRDDARDRHHRVPGRRRAGMPCPTCPGGTGRARRRVCLLEGRRLRARRSPHRPRRPGGAAREKEPAALSQLAASGGELGARAANVLARSDVAGQAWGNGDVTPLTVDEQRRFEAGREIYRNICQACHQPDGRGQDRVAPSLVGSPLLLAAAGVPTRILLNGKEGKVGLMPPIGFVLDDEQIAGVLTYVRREWGQTGAPVDPASVKAIRRPLRVARGRGRTTS